MSNKTLAALRADQDYHGGMDLESWKDNWDQLGKDDPLWVILTDESKRGGKWKVDEFFETGRGEISGVLLKLTSLGVTPAWGKALDFGCGVGRLSQALSAHFQEVHGVDISPSMIARAKDFAGSLARCQFHVNSTDRLELFTNDTFDFVYSNIALQHIEPQYAKRYIEEFFRVLKPGGVAVFQTLSATILRGLFPQSVVDLYRRIKHRGKPIIGMFGIPEPEIANLISRAGAEVINVDTSNLGWRWRNRLFVARKRSQ